MSSDGTLPGVQRSASKPTLPRSQALLPRRAHGWEPVAIGFGGAVAFAVLYWPALGLGFVGDDWVTLGEVSQRRLSALFDPMLVADRRDLFHFIPLKQAVFKGLFAAFGLEPFWWHAVLLAVHLLNATLVGVFGHRVLHLNAAQAAVAGVAFALTFHHYEVLLWVTCLSYALTALLVLCGLLSFSAFGSSGGVLWMAAYCAALLGAALTAETGIVLVPIAAALDLLLAAPRQSTQGARLAAIFRRQLPALCVLLAWVAYRSVAVTRISSSDVPVLKSLATFVYSLFGAACLNLPAVYELLFDHKRVAALVVLCGLGALVTLGRPSVRFCVVSFIVAFGPNYVLSGFQARYFYLPGIFLALAAGIAAGSDGRTRSWRSRAVAAYVLLTAAPSYGYLRSRLAEWAWAWTAVTTTLDVVHRSSPTGAGVLDAPVLAVNAPDTFGYPWGPAFPAHVFRNGLPEAIALSYGQPSRLPAVEYFLVGQVTAYVPKGRRRLDRKQLSDLGACAAVLDFEPSDPGTVRVHVQPPTRTECP